MLSVLAIYVNLIKAGVFSEEETSIEKMPPPDPSGDKPRADFLNQ